VGAIFRGMLADLTTLVNDNSAYHEYCFWPSRSAEGIDTVSSACASALEFPRADASRAFSGGWNISQFRVTHEALFVFRIVLQRNFHRMRAAFKSEFKSFVAHRKSQEEG